RRGGAGAGVLGPRLPRRRPGPRHTAVPRAAPGAAGRCGGVDTDVERSPVITLTVPDDVLAKLRETFLVIEGDCEAWTDEEIVRRTLIRGAMDYAKAANRP